MTDPYVRRRDETEDLAWIGGTTHHLLINGEDTDGRLAAFRSAMAPGAAAPVHVHPTDDETLFVLEGEMVVWAGAQRWTLTGGDSVFLPRGLPHTYHVVASSDVLTVCNPAGMDRFLRSAGWDLTEPVPDGWEVDLGALRDAAAATGQTVLGPPLAPDDDMPEQFRVAP